MARAKKDSTEAYNAPFPVRLRELMEQHRCTQADLAEVSGRTRQTVSQYATGMSEPGYDVLVKIALYFGVTTDYLLGRTDDPAPKPAAVDELGLTPEVVEILTQLRSSSAADIWKPFVNDMILGTMVRSDAFVSYLTMTSALKLPEHRLPEGEDGEDPILSWVKLRHQAERSGYVLFSAEESFRYHAEKVGEALTRWLIDTYQDQGAWNRKEDQ